VPFPDDLITPTLKVKRNVAGKHFKDIIDELYGQPVKSKDKRTSKL
jgi:long-chain acyl-CoA synthetase